MPNPTPEQAKQIMADIRKGEAAKATLGGVSTRLILSEDPEPKPVLIFDKASGMWKEYQPVCFYNLPPEA